MPFQNHAGLLRRIGDPPSTVCSPFAKPQVGSPPVARKGVYGRTFLIYRSKPAWFWGAGEGRFAIGPDNGTGGARKTLLNGVRRVPRAKSAGVRAVRGPGAPRVGAVPSAPALAKVFFKIVLASPSEFPYSTFSHGGVAQLGERLTGSQEVRGSIPLVSTRALNEAPTKVGAFFHIGTQGQRRHHDPPGRQDRKKLRRARPL